MSTAIEKLKESQATLESIMRLNNPNGDVATMVLQEIQYVEERITLSPSIAECTTESILICVRKAIANNLTLDPDAKLMYMIPGSVKVNDKWVKVLTAPRTANGELSVAYQCGTILDHERPIAEYNDKFQCVKVIVKLQRPSVPVPRWETITYDGVYFHKWKVASHKKNARGKNDADLETLNYANELYSSFNGGIDPEFAIAKSLRHSLEKLGTNPNAKRATNITIPLEKTVQVFDAEAEVMGNDETGVTTFNI